MRWVVLLALPALLGGCIMERVENQERANASEKSYRECLQAHVDKPAVCDPLKEVWEHDRLVIGQ